MSTLLQSNSIKIEVFELPSNASDTELGLERLSSAEKARADKISHKQTRAMHIYSKRVLRERLSQIIQTDLENIAYTTNQYGKPYLDSLAPSSKVFFNISHSKHRLAIGFSSLCELGIDIQYHDPKGSARELAERFFAKQEVDFLNKCHATDYLKNFYQIWSRKEAVIKAIGKGLQLPLDSFSVCRPEDTANDLKKQSVPEFLPTKLNITSITLPFPDFSAAVAWQGDFRELKIQSSID